jgi:peptide/nickel transport system substrate-binding protein
LKVVLGGDIRGLDPHATFDDVTDTVLGNVFETLVLFDPNLQLVPGLALRWINPDERTWRFYLDPQARFSDGTPLRAEDVKFSLERLRGLKESHLSGFVRHVQSADAVDERTVDVRTETPVAILNDLALIPIVRRALGSPAGAGPSLLGTGPYFVASWQPGRRLELQANPHRPAPAIARAEFLIRSAGWDAPALREARADLALFPHRARLEELQRELDPSLALVKAGGLSVYYVTFNLRPTLPGRAGPNPLRDARARQALDLAVDRAALAAAVPSLRPVHQLVVPEVFGYDPTLAPVAPDAARARRLAHEAGLHRTELHLDAPDVPGARLPQALVAQWRAAGIGVTLRLHPPAELPALVEQGRFEVTYEGYACGSGDASELLTFALHSPDPSRGYGAGNTASYANAEVDRIAEENLRVFDPRARLALLQRALRRAAEDRPYVPLVSVEDVYVVSKALRFRPRPSGELRLAEIRWDGP